MEIDSAPAPSLADFERIAAALAIRTDRATLERLSVAASFENMKRDASRFAPAAGKAWHDDARFFSKGSHAQWEGVLEASDLERYERRMRALLPGPDVEWLESGNAGRSADRRTVPVL